MTILPLLLALAGAAHAQRVVVPVLPLTPALPSISLPLAHPMGEGAWGVRGPLLAAPNIALPAQTRSLAAPQLRLTPTMPSIKALPLARLAGEGARGVRGPLQAAAPDVGEGHAVEAADPMRDAMRMQGWLLGILAKSYGHDVVVLSMAMSAYRAGLSVQDYLEIMKELVAIEASADEAEAALLHATARSPFAKPLGPENRPDAGDYAVLRVNIRELAREVEILRNNRFMGWTYDLAAGKPTPDFAPAPDVRAGEDGEWRIRLGYLREGDAALPLTVLARPQDGKAPDLSYFLDPVLASPRLDAARRAVILALARELERLGVRTSSSALPAD